MKEKIQIAIVFFMLINAYTFSQKNTTTEKHSITEIVELENVSQNEIYSRIKKWIVANYKDSNEVIKYTDDNTIIIKGVNHIEYDNLAIKYDPKNKYHTKTIKSNFNHTIEFNTKPGKYRIKYKIDSYTENNLNHELLNESFKFINFNGIEEAKLIEYTKNILKKYKLKEPPKLMEQTKSQFKILNDELKNDAINTINLIKSYLIKKRNNDW